VGSVYTEPVAKIAMACVLVVGKEQRFQRGPRGIQAHRGHDRADTVVSGPVPGPYLLLWNRQDAQTTRVTVSGDLGVLRLWRDAVHVRWP
jgi:hypothetical protein